MAIEKRKAVVADRPAKKIKFDESGKPKEVSNGVDKRSTRPTTDSKPKAKSEGNPQEDSQRKSVKSSLLSGEERSFPRGGASILTPLEQRQVKADADRDVLFEESRKSKVVREEYGEDEGLDDGQGKGAPKKRSKGKKSKPVSKDDETELVRIQGLGYKNIAVGSLVLGQVTSITSKDVALALPNNLTGYIPITAISDTVNERIQSLLAEDQKDNDESDDNEDIDLQKLFRPGQFLRAYVTATASESSRGTKSKRHIELSVNPQQANTGLTTDLETNYMVQASVKSVEDHGLVMDIGLEEKSVRGFVSKKELGQNWKLEDVQEGQVMLCCVTGRASDGKVVKLCPDPLRISDLNKHVLKEAKTIDPFMPGAAVEVLVTSVSGGGISGKIIGMIDATADVMHSGSGVSKEAFEKIKPAQKIQARIIFTIPNTDSKKVGVSLLDHVRKFEEQAKSIKKKRKLESSQFLDDAKVIRIVPGSGVYFDVNAGQPAFAHISRLSDENVDALFEETGPYALNTTHKARVLGYNPLDGVYNVSLQKSVLDRKYLKLEDVKVGSTVEGKVEKMILGPKGITGILVTLEDGITGLVPEMHMADVKLQHPEKRFRENFPIKARVLSVDSERRQMRLTLKKTLLNTDAAIWKDYSEINVGDESAGTIINVKSNGAVVQFFGAIRAWLPVSEMSEAYISDASQHFHVGQTVTVHAKQVNPADNEMIVSCRDSPSFDDAQTENWNKLRIGEVITAKIAELAKDVVSFELDSGIKGLCRIAQLTDGTEERSRKLLGSLRVGQKMSELLILDKNERRHTLTLSNKSSLIKASKDKSLIKSFSDAKAGTQAQGFVRNVTPDGVFVEFAAGTVGYMPKTQITKERLAQPAFGYRKDMSVSAKVLSVDASQERFVLTIREDQSPKAVEKKVPAAADVAVQNPVDGESTSLEDFILGKQTKARITSVKDTQLNVQLADNIQGRIDVSEVFDSWDEIKDRKRPLSKFKTKQVLTVRILGIHDARNHHFLPISHRSSRVPVFELTARSAELQSDNDIPTLSNLTVGSTHIAFVNNISDSCLWANITPNIRGRIPFLDLSADSGLQDISANYPVGSALRVDVKSLDPSANRLDLVPAGSAANAITSIADVSLNASYPGKVVRVTERSVLVALSDTVSGVIDLTSIADDFGTASTAQFTRNDMIRVSVIDIDTPNKRLFLSVRPSKVLSSSLPVADPQITALSQLKAGNVRRGFVKLVRRNGVVVALGPRVESFVKVADLSDRYIKDWQAEFEVDQLVQGRVIEVDEQLNHVQMTLKESQTDKNYVPPKKMDDLEVGEIITGRVRKVEEFGVFVDVDDTNPRVSGLCHRTQIADGRIGDIKTLYGEGDKVKAKILAIDLEKRRISFGLKASYFKDTEDDDEDEEMESMDEEDEAGVTFQSDSEDEEMDVDGGIDLDLIQAMEAGASSSDEEEEDSEQEGSETDMSDAPSTAGLKTSGFDWTGTNALVTARTEDSDDEATTPAPKSAKPTKSEPYIDRTGDMDLTGPQTPSDFERLLLSTPHSSALWIQYMAHHLRLSEISTARSIAHRALTTIPLREVDEKQQIWIALLNLEVNFGSSGSDASIVDPEADARLESTFRDACQVQDPFAMHLHLASILTQAGRLDAAEKLYDAMVASNPANATSPFGAAPGGQSNVTNAKMAKAFRGKSETWLTFATFLFEKGDAGKARGLLSRALQSVPEREKRELTAKFAGLEFKGVGGDAERGRTVMEGVVGEWPRWNAGWDMWVEGEEGVLRRVMEGEGEVVEKKKGKKGKAVKEVEREQELKDQVERVRKLFERMTKGKMKARRARTVFKRWREFEEKHGEERDVERVMGLATEWVENASRSKEEDGDDE
ncbi:rRNA bioproteinsis protein rrp5 [Elsinoe australis]|uniref:rRNA biogenesis protein RRP5 n=1 Tax=Elsinoe australis TaxID=40998 RepID=A0A2P7Z492_9PEZI|nr:rRNA bioproteinsis protein rrp5 [Elsinoe australis]